MRRFTVITLFVAILCALLFITSLVMSLRWRPLKKQVIYPALPPTPAPTTTTTTTTTTIIITTTAAPTTAAPTTAPPTFAPLTLLCPPNINITLGSSLELTATGYPDVSGGDIVNCAAPVAFFSDEPVGIVARSPSFADANLVPTHFNTTTLVTANSYISSAIASDDATILSATESEFKFLYPSGSPFVLNGTQGSVYWDGSANRFLILETGPSGPVSTLFLHLNNSLSPNGWATLVFNISGTNPQLGVWPRAYVVTVAAATNNMCVLDRLSILAGDTDPLYFCSTSILGSLAGFSVDRQSWTPLGATFVDDVLPEIESAGTNTIGAVFMRHHDDELHNGASTPLFDWLDIEQWTNINFTTHDFISLRYTVSINDFDSTPFSIVAPDASLLDPWRENIMPRLVFQTQHNKTAVVFSSHSVGNNSHIRWVELKWQTPTNLLAARFILSQENKTSTTDGFQRWMPTAIVDAYGNTVIGYNLCDNATVWPSMYATSRLNNDPSTGLRQEVLVYEGTAPLGGGEWGPWASMSSVVPREFLYSGQVSQGLHVVRKIRMTGNIIERTFTGANNCEQITCIQTITES
jgi:hypothetical protein